MKKIIIILAFICAPIAFFGQSSFDKFYGQDDVKAVSINKKMLQIMGNMKMDLKDNKNQQYLNLVKKLDNLEVFTTGNVRIANEMKAASSQHIKSAGLEELMRITDSGKNIRIMVKSGAGNSQIKELLMFIEGSGKENQTVLMSLTGDFDLDEISVLTEKMNLPGGDALKKASKK